MMSRAEQALVTDAVVPALGRVHPARLVSLPTETRLSVPEHLMLVDDLLTLVVADLNELWAGVSENSAGAIDVLGASDLPALMGELISGGGKRIRPVMSYLGWLCGAGPDRGGYRDVVRVGAALELLHLFVLVHDDVMDESTTRRGRPTVHLRARRLHESSAATGSASRFGESIAILVGDLAHAEAGNLVADLPVAMRRIWRTLVAELVAGQRHDLVGSAAGRRDLRFARTVARMKSGRYTVERPLELGAAAAGAPTVVTQSLAGYGRAVGEAFALRDDLLGIWGDPQRTGKPAGDDLISGKPTVILALAAQRVRAPAAVRALSRVGTSTFDRADVALLQQELQTSGVVAAVEAMIAEQVAAALAALDNRALDSEGVAQLTAMAHQIAWRDQ